MEDNVFLYVPNIIGYIRILLTLMSCYYMLNDWPRAALYYIISELLDSADGHAARLLNQSSRFGAMLDMLTDRCSTMCLLMVLGVFYPKYFLLFQLSSAIDIASHWLYMHSNDIHGSKSHKCVSDTTNLVLKLYYSSRKFLFFMCAGNELFYCLLYILHFTDGFVVPLLNVGIVKILLLLVAPVAMVKTAISVVHLFVASKAIAELDTKERHP